MLTFCIKPSSITIALATALAIAPVAHAAAGAITWSSVINETGNATDIVTSGTYVDAATAGVTTTVNGVLFHGRSTAGTGTIGFAGSGITISNIIDGAGPGPGAAPGTWNAAYQTLVSAGAYGDGNSNQVQITISGLTSGASYTLQILEPYWNASYPTTFSDGTNTSGPLNMGVGTSVVPQYVTGTFSATGTTQVVNLGATAFGVEMFGAIEIRSLPEPPTIAITSMATLALLRLRRRRRTT